MSSDTNTTSHEPQRDVSEESRRFLVNWLDEHDLDGMRQADEERMRMREQAEECIGWTGDEREG